MQTLHFKRPSILPGFWPAFGYTVLYLSLIVLIPLSAVFLKTATSSWAHFWKVITSPQRGRVLSTELRRVAGRPGLISVVVGFLVAWVLVRYEFPGKALVDALVDLPFALPTAVAESRSPACTRKTAGSASISRRSASRWRSRRSA